MRRCKVIGCIKKHQSNGYCDMHDTRMKKYGSIHLLTKKRKCSISGCKNKHYGLGFCSKHHARYKKYGDPFVNKIYVPIEKRFPDNIMTIPECGCWIWMGGLTGSGYGTISVNGNLKLAHRFSWELNIGVIPKGMLVLHKCDTPSCVNPEHLFIGTYQDNTDDMMKKGRSKHLIGEGCSSTKLNETQVKEIRRLPNDEATRKYIVKKFDIDRQTISDIKNRRTWRHI